MRRHTANALLIGLLTITSVTNYTLWLVTVRCLFDGDSYQWGMRLVLSPLGGTGTNDDFWVLPLMTAFVLGLIYLGSRGARAPFAAMLFGWYGTHLFAALRLAAQYGDEWRFRGDTLGIDVSLAWVMPTVYVLIMTASVAWYVLTRNDQQHAILASWSKINLILLVAAVAIVPLQYPLLRFGEPHGMTDKIGVLLTVTQWVLVSMALSFPSDLLARRRLAA